MLLVQSAQIARYPWLASQLLRAAGSSCANIAEGFSRYHPKEFARFLRMANGSLSEVIEHLTAAVQIGAATPEQAANNASTARRARGAASKLIVYLKDAKPPGPR